MLRTNEQPTDRKDNFEDKIYRKIILPTAVSVSVSPEKPCTRPAS
jgi:hypothetical protein